MAGLRVAKYMFEIST